jgi:hypothetical protein
MRGDFPALTDDPVDAPSTPRIIVPGVNHRRLTRDRRWTSYVEVQSCAWTAFLQRLRDYVPEVPKDDHAGSWVGTIVFSLWCKADAKTCRRDPERAALYDHLEQTAERFYSACDELDTIGVAIGQAVEAFAALLRLGRAVDPPSSWTGKPPEVRPSPLLLPVRSMPFAAHAPPTRARPRVRHGRALVA